MSIDIAGKSKLAVVCMVCLVVLVQSGRVCSQTFEEFRTLANKSYDLYERQQIDEALKLARHAEQIVNNSSFSENRDFVTALNTLGMVFFNTGFNQAAKPLYERAMSLATKILPENDVLFRRLHNNLGQVEGRLGNLQDARSHLESALLLAEQSNESPLELARVMDNLASIYTTMSELDKGEELHKKTLAIFEHENGTIDVDVATALGNLGTLYMTKRDYAQAEAYLLRALDTYFRLSGIEHGETSRNVGKLTELYLATGNEVRAEQLVNLLLTIGGEQPSGRHMELANAMTSLARRVMYTQYLGLAERLSARALQLFEAAAGPNAPETCNAIRLLADVYSEKGNWPSAEKYYLLLLKPYQVMDKYEAAQVKIGFGRMLRRRGKQSFPMAREMFENAIKDLQSLSSANEDDLASALGNLGELHYADDQPELAEAKYQEALTLVEHRQYSRERPWLLHNQAMLLYHLAKYAEARTAYEEAKRLWTARFSSDNPFVGTTAANLALVYWAQGDFESALQSFAESSKIEEYQAQLTLTIGTEWERLAYAQGMLSNMSKVISFCFANDQRQSEPAELAATLLLQRKGRVLDAMAQTMIQVRENLSAEDRILLDRLDSVRRQIAEIVTPTLVSHNAPTDDRRLAMLKEQEENLQSTLSHKSAFYSAHLTPVTLEMVKRALPADAALVEYLKYSVFDPVRTGKGEPWRGERYAAIVLRPQSGPELYDLGPAQEIETSIQKFRQYYGHVAPANTSSQRGVRVIDSGAVHTNTARLHQLLIAPVSRMLSGARLLLISPDGALNLIPFGLLGDEQSGRLTDRFVINYLYSGRELVQKGQFAASSIDVVVFANPDFDAEVKGESENDAGRFTERSGFGSLTGTHGEAEVLRGLFGGVMVLEGKQATAENLKAIRHPAILHVATHGVFEPLQQAEPEWKTSNIFTGDKFYYYYSAVPSMMENPMLYSGIVLAGANRSEQGKQYGIMTALEIANLDLHGTELAVLSACETGVGTSRPGEEFAGLRRALSIAGAASQVTSLWKVNDEATRTLMTHYYQRLLQGYGRAEALQLAQRFIEHTPQWKDPSFWAAFVSSGDWRPLSNFLNKPASSKN